MKKIIRNKNIWLGSFFIFLALNLFLLGETKMEAVANDLPVKIDEKKQATSDELAILEIIKLNLKRKLYGINDKRNKVSKNPQIMKPSDLPDIAGGQMIIAAHSGNSRVAYFNKLDLLKINDEIYFYYQGVKYTYAVEEIIIQDKNGQITLVKVSYTSLILTTCHPKKKGKQLIVQARLTKKINEKIAD